MTNKDKYQQQLFTEMTNGNQQSFKELFETYYAPLCHYARQFIADRDECEEVVQDFFARLWFKRKKISINRSVASYFFGAVRNGCYNFIKHQKIRKKHQEATVLNEQNLYDETDCFLEVGLAQKIDAAIAGLPERRREIFLMNREQGLKYREIAEKLNLSIKTVETQMGHALKTLREQLKTYRSSVLTFFFFCFRQ